MMPQTSAPRVEHVADGNTNEFNFDFAIFQSSDLEVLLDTSLQVDGFTVQGGYPSNGGTVVFSQAPAAGTVVTLQRRLSIERASDFQPTGALVANTLNQEFDRLVAMVQQVDDDASRALRAAPTEADANMLLPAREARAGRILGFDEAGDVTTLAANLPEITNLDAIPEGGNNKHFTSAEKEKLAGVEPGSEANPPQVTAEEKANGSELSLRSFAPRDVADMARTSELAGAVSSVFGRTGAVGAQAGDYRANQITDTATKVMMTAAERAKLAGFVTVTDFGAVGDGVTDDTAAFQAAAAYVVQKKKALRVPAGTYLLKQTIAFANAPVALLGDGIGLSILKWAADATSLGISISANSSEHSHLIRDLSCLVCKKGGTALNLDYSGQVNATSFLGKAITMDRTSPRFLIDNCFFAGAADPWTTGWDYGVVATAAVSGVIANCYFTGWLASQPMVAGSQAAFFMRGTNNTYENGHPVQFLILGCSAYYVTSAVALNGVEGAFVQSCNFVQVMRGIYWEDSYGRPQVNVANCHINALHVGIFANNCGEATILGNLFYGSDQAPSQSAGIQLAGTITEGSSFFSICGNTFENTSTSQIFTGIAIMKASYGLIDSNVFRCATTAIWLSNQASNCRVGGSNIFAPSPRVVTRVLNQGTNNSVAL